MDMLRGVVILSLAVVLSGLLMRLDAAITPSATVTWTAPTTYTDGSPIISTDLDHYTVSWSRTIGGSVVGSQTVTAPATSAVVPVVCGNYQFTVTVSTAGATSLPAGPLAYASGVACTPNPPAALVVH